jgi:filamentous hemagglutinin
MVSIGTVSSGGSAQAANMTSITIGIVSSGGSVDATNTINGFSIGTVSSGGLVEASTLTGTSSTPSTVGTLAGTLSATGPNSIDMVSIGTVSSGGSAQATNMTSITVGTLSSGGKINASNSITNIAITNAAGTVTAKTIVSPIFGNFSGSYTATGDMVNPVFTSIGAGGVVQVDGNVIGTLTVSNNMAGTIIINGNVFASASQEAAGVTATGAIIIGGSDSGTIIIGGGLGVGSMSIGGSLIAGGVVNVTGNLNSMSIAQDLNGQLNAGTLGSLNVGGNLNGPLSVAGTLSTLSVGGSLSGKLSAGSIGQIGVLASQGASAVDGVVLDVTEGGVERLVEVSAAPGSNTSNATFKYIYEGSAFGLTPQIAIQVINTNPAQSQFDLSLVTYSDTAQFDLALVTNGSTTKASTGINNVAVEGDLLNGITSAMASFLGLPANTLGGVNLAYTALTGVAIRDHAYAGTVQAASIQGVAFGSLTQTNGSLVTGSNANNGQAMQLLAAGTTVIQAGQGRANSPSVFRVPFGDQQPVIFYVDTQSSNHQFDSSVLFTNLDTSIPADMLPPNTQVRGAVTALITVAVPQSGGNAALERIDLIGDGGSISTNVNITGDASGVAITSTGPLGNLTLTGSQGLVGTVIAPSIFGNITVTGPITGAIETTGIRTDSITGAQANVAGDLGEIIENAQGNYTGSTTITTNGTFSGKIICAGNLYSQVNVSGSFSGSITAGGNIGADQVSGNFFALNSSSGQPVSTGGVSVSGGDSGTITSTGGSIYGAIGISGNMSGTLSTGTGDIVGQVTVSGTFSGTISAAGNIGAAEMASDGVNIAVNSSGQLVLVGGITVNGTDTGTISAGKVTNSTTGASSGGNIYGPIKINGGMNGSTSLSQSGGLNVGTTSGAQIIALGNMVGSLYVNGSMSGLIAVQGDVGAIKLNSNGTALLTNNALTRYGSFNINGATSGEIVVLGNVFCDMTLNGSLSGVVAVEGREEYSLPASNTTAGQNPLFANTSGSSSVYARIGILGKLTLNGALSGTLVSGGVIGDDGFEYNPQYAESNDSTGTTFSVSNNKGIIAATEDINGGSNNGKTNGYFQDVAYTFSSTYDSAQNLAALASIFTNGGSYLLFNTPSGGYSGLSLILGDLENLSVASSGNLTGSVK